MLKEVMVTMADGVELWTSCFLPGEGAYPVVFIRCPYGPPLPDDANHMRMNAAGYAVVYQECRGTSRSQGQWVPFTNEEADGLTTLDWISHQPFFMGETYLYGGSYLAYVHLCMLDKLPAFVKGAMLSVFSTDQYAAGSLGGLFKHDLFTAWMLSMPPTGITPAPERFFEALTVRPQVDIPQRILGVDLPWFRDALMHPYRDDAWTVGAWGEFVQKAARSTIPVVYVAGWHDVFIGGMLNTWQGLGDAHKRWSMIIGPWTHGCAILTDFDSEMPLPNGDTIGFNAPECFFDSIRRGIEYDVVASGAVKRYVIGAGEWTSYGDIGENATPTVFYLNNDGLSTQPGARDEITYTFDPRNPAHFPGGENVFVTEALGITKQPKPNFRSDVLSFVSQPFTNKFRLEGRLDIRLRVKSDCPDTAFIARVSVVKDTEAYIMREYASTMRYVYADYVPGTSVDLPLSGAAIAWEIQPGEAIRVDITSSNLPAFAVHANTAQLWSLETQLRVAHNTIVTGESYVSLPRIR